MRDFIRRYNAEHGATLILTSHYMDDVAALCPRVIVIDKGVLSYDGKLEQLVQRVRPEKRLVLRFSAEVSTERVKELGNVVKHEAAEAVLQIPHDAVNTVVARAPRCLP